MPVLANLYNNAKENNIISGIILFEIIAFLSYVIVRVDIMFAGDIHLIFGGIVSLLFALKNRKETQSVLKTSLSVGLIGAILSAVSMSVFEGTFGSFPFLFYLVNFLLLGVVIGLVLSFLIGYYYYRKDLRHGKTKSNSKYTDEYLEDLLKK
jgi:hypothetical protein